MGATATVELPLREPGDCVACAERLRERLAAHRGVTAVEPVSGRDAVRVTYDPDLCSLDCLDETTEGLRLDLTSAYRHEVGTIDGMDCADCARTIESAVGRMGGVTNVSVSYPAARLRVEFQPSEVEMDAIVQRITRLGYRVPEHSSPYRAGRLALLRSRDGTTAISIALMAAALLLDLATSVTPIPLYAAAIIAGGLPLARAGVIAALATRRPDINLLMTIATVGAVAIDAWLEAALVVVLFSIGQLLESRAAERARRELAGLVALTPDTAHVRRRQGSGPFALLEEIELPVAELVVGDVVIVRPGERIPVDALVVEGASAVDQAPITGESVPVDKAPGDAVFAGTLNGQGLLALATNAAPGDSTLDRIGALVAEAQARKSPSERWVDSFARWYTPAVVGVAASVALLPPIFGVAWSTSVYDALALLILACPCALVISTPVAIVSALARASAAGVLVKGGAHLEQAAAIRAVAFDKTGTLTLGRPRVDEIIATEGNERDILALVAALESGSEHPLARAIVAAAHERGLTVATPDTFEALPGLGARGTVAGRDVEVGDTRLFPTLPKTLAHQLARLRERGCTAVVVALDGRPVGAIGISDTLRPEATDAISDLRRLGIDQIVLLTGDNAVTAAAVAASVGIHDVRAGLMPHDKATAADTIDSLAMVGDGVNDAPALARASLGIAMGTAGSDTAIEVADVAIMGDDPRKVAGLIGLGRWTRSIVRQNIGFSLGTKLLAAAILAAGALPLWGAVVTDVGASLIVTANGLRLVRGHPIGTRRALPLLPGRSRHATPAARPAPACHIDHDH